MLFSISTSFFACFFFQSYFKSTFENECLSKDLRKSFQEIIEALPGGVVVFEKGHINRPLMTNQSFQTKILIGRKL